MKQGCPCAVEFITVHLNKLVSTEYAKGVIRMGREWRFFYRELFYYRGFSLEVMLLLLPLLFRSREDIVSQSSADLLSRIVNLLLSFLGPLSSSACCQLGLPAT